MNVIGLDLGGTKLASAIFDEQGTILNKVVAPLNGREGAEVGTLITSQLDKLLAGAGQVQSVGISVPGIYYAGSGHVWAPNIPGWTDFPLLETVQSALSSRGIRVLIDSDRACYILGETWKGAARGCRNAVYLAVGTGIGAGILIDGKVLRGAQDIAGAVGWMGLNRPFREEYARYGCFEYHASGEGIVRLAREYIKMEEGYKGALSEKSSNELTTADLFDAFDQNDPVAHRVIDECIVYWGMAAANLVSLLNPEKVIFGGGVFGPGGRFLNEIKKEAGKWGQPISMKQVGMEVSALGGEAGLYGAGKLALMGL